MTLEHKKRWITAVLGVGLISLIYFFFRHNGVILITFFISSMALFEFLHFSGKMIPEKWLTLLIGMGLSVWLNLQMPEEGLAIGFSLFVLVVDALRKAHFQGEHDLKKDFWSLEYEFFAILYLILFPSYVSKIHNQDLGPNFLLMLFVLIICSDTAAYYGGKTFGKRKLSAFISPGKTREGSITALLACTIVAVILFTYFTFETPLWKACLLGFGTSLVSQMGDLTESFLKRAYAVKDSGTLLPGHGGFFDRFDSLILAAPFFYFMVRFFL